MKRTIVISTGFAALAACSNISNQPLTESDDPNLPNSELRLDDLEPFATTGIAAQASSAFELVTRTAQRGVPPATILFSSADGLWSGQQVDTDLRLDRTSPTGAIEASRTIDLTLVMVDATVHDVAASANGTFWLAVGGRDGYLLASYAPGAVTPTQRIGIFNEHASGSTWPQPVMPLAVADGRIYVGRGLQLIVLDQATGAVVDDLTPRLQAAAGPLQQGGLQAIAAGHGRILARLWPDDVDTISFDLTTYDLTSRIAGVPVGNLAVTPGGFAGIDENGQVVEFVIDRQVPMLTIEQTVAFSMPPFGVAVEDGVVWVGFVDWAGSSSPPPPTFVAYDPMTLEPVAGFRGSKETGWGFGNKAAFGFAADAGHMYVAMANHLHSLPHRATLETMDRTTGKITGSTPLDFRPAGVCLDEDLLYIAGANSFSDDSSPRRPTVHVANRQTGLVVETRVAEFATLGDLFGVACVGRPFISSGWSRFWTTAESVGSTVPNERFAHPERTSRGGACLDGKLFTVDEVHQTLSRADAPSVCPTASSN